MVLCFPRISSSTRLLVRINLSSFLTLSYIALSRLQKPQLQEFIESHGHLCDFYPKYHCELNFIEQYWGAAKLRFRSMRRAATLEGMEKLIISCLDDIPLLQIRR